MKQHTSLLQHLQLGFSVITSVWFRPTYYHRVIVPRVANEANAASVFRAARTAAHIISLCAYIVPLTIYIIYHERIIIGSPLLVALSSIILLFLGDGIGHIGYRRSTNALATILRITAVSPLLPLCFSIVASSALLLRIWLGPTYYRGTNIPVPLYLSAFPIGISMLFLMMLLYHVPPEPPRLRHMFQRIATFFVVLLWVTLIILHGLHPILGYGSYTPFSREWLKIYFGLQIITFGVSIVLGRCLNPSTPSTPRQR